MFAETARAVRERMNANRFTHATRTLKKPRLGADVFLLSA